MGNICRKPKINTYEMSYNLEELIKKNKYLQLEIDMHNKINKDLNDTLITINTKLTNTIDKKNTMKEIYDKINSERQRIQLKNNNLKYQDDQVSQKILNQEKEINYLAEKLNRLYPISNIKCNVCDCDSYDEPIAIIKPKDSTVRITCRSCVSLTHNASVKIHKIYT